MKNILITGSNGFVGKNLRIYLTSCGYHVRGTYRNNSGITFPSSTHDDNVYFSLNDARNDYHVLLDDIDCVVHLAALAHVGHGKAPDAEQFIKLNAEGTMQLVENAVQKGVRKIVFLSTVGVNGNVSSENKRFNEADEPQPHNDYSRSKFLAEKHIAELCNGTGTSYTILRAPLIYGPFVGSNFFKLLVYINAGIPLPLATLRNKRSILYTENLNCIVRKCIEENKSDNKLFLISDHDIAVNELLHKLSASLNKPARTFRFPTQLLKMLLSISGKKTYINSLCHTLLVDSGNIRETLNWQPEYSLDEGLKNTVAWFSCEQ